MRSRPEHGCLVGPIDYRIRVYRLVGQSYLNQSNDHETPTLKWATEEQRAWQRQCAYRYFDRADRLLRAWIDRDMLAQHA